MPQNKINKQEILINAAMGLGLYVLLQQLQKKQAFDKKISSIGSLIGNTGVAKANGSITVGPMTDAGVDWSKSVNGKITTTVNYFNDSEYQGKFTFLKGDYFYNWLILKAVLNTIRVAFGSAIYITKGYTPDDPLASFQHGYGCNIYPKNNNYDYLLTVIKALNDQNKICVDYELKPDKQIYVVLRYQ